MSNFTKMDNKEQREVNGGAIGAGTVFMIGVATGLVAEGVDHCVEKATGKSIAAHTFDTAEYTWKTVKSWF